MSIWTILAVSVAIVSFFCISVMEIFQDKSYYEAYKWYACPILIVIGTGLWVLGKSLRGKKGSSITDGEDYSVFDRDSPVAHADDMDEENAPFIFSPLYWGPMIIVFGITLIFIIPHYSLRQAPSKSASNLLQKTNKAMVPIARANSRSSPIPPKPVEPKAVKFPKIKLQGMIFNPTNPSVIVKGKAFFKGDFIEGAEILAITRSNVTLQIAGNIKLIPIDW